jgi:hypothetical protein
VSAGTITNSWSGPVTQVTQQLTPVVTQLTPGLSGLFGAAAGGAAPQFTIGPITVGSQQSIPVTPQTITPGGGGGGGTFTPIQTITPFTPGGGGGTLTTIHTFTPITGGSFTPFGLQGMGGAAPQFTIGGFTLGSQQSWPISQFTITSGWSGGSGTPPVTPIQTFSPVPPTQTVPPISVQSQF